MDHDITGQGLNYVLGQKPAVHIARDPSTLLLGLARPGRANICLVPDHRLTYWLRIEVVETAPAWQSRGEPSVLVFIEDAVGFTRLLVPYGAQGRVLKPFP